MSTSPISLAPTKSDAFPTNGSIKAAMSSYASVPGLKRDLMVYIWFPADVTKRTKIAPYMDGGPLWDIASGHPSMEGMIHSHAYNTSNLDTSQPTYPVLVFVHGFTESPLNYASIIEDVASHGYIVIGTTHPYSSGAVSYPDGRVILQSPVGKGRTADTGVLTTWVLDVHFVLDQAEKLNASDETFKGHLDLSRIGVFGHSFGGYTTDEVTASDKRVKAGAALDRATTTNLGSKPFLFVGTRASPTAAQQTADKYWLLIDGTEHYNYGDFGLLLPLTSALYGGDYTSQLGNIDPARGIQIVDSYVVAFFDHYLKGSDLKWPKYDEAKLIVFPSTASN